jgi:hypothetical protein
MVAAVFGCIFGIFGIFTIGAIFVPLAALCSAVAFLTGIFQLRISVILMALVSSCVTVVAFAVSPSAWLLFASLSGSGHNGTVRNEDPVRKNQALKLPEGYQSDCQTRWIEDAKTICH